MINKVCIDPGHGGADNGAAYGYAEEDDLNLSIAYLLRCELEKLHLAVVMTREADEHVGLSDRALLANLDAADLFVSIHCDAFHVAAASGISTHIHTKADGTTKMLAGYVHRAIMDAFPDHKDRGVRRSNFYVLRKTLMPAMLIECEFLSNPDTRRFLREPENQLAMAQAIANGIG